MSEFFVLSETASGYALFTVSGFEEIGVLLPQVQKSVKEYKLFKKNVKFTAFHPFTSAENALENIQKVSENQVHEDLTLFLNANLPKPKSMKKEDQFLGVQTPIFAGSIQDETKHICKTSDVVNEILRGIRLHLQKYISKLQDGVGVQAQLGLGHGYSRSKVKFNVNKQDNMLIQAISVLDQLDKDLNTNAMRVKEWYSWHFPELQKLLPDPYMFANFVNVIGSRAPLLQGEEEEILEKINGITMDEDLAKEIVKAAKSSMGFEISTLDLVQLQEFSLRVVSLGKYRTALINYLANKVAAVCPNLGSLIGDSLASRLISHAGSLISLAKCPASTIQILGAEKALFRALKTKGNTPKYGLLFNSGFIGKAKQSNKGRISRYLANKCALAARIDCFTESVSKGEYGDALRQQVEDRLKFLDTGEKPRKNAEVMGEVSSKLKADGDGDEEMEEATPNGNGNGNESESDDSEQEEESKKDKKKKKKRKRDKEENGNGNGTPSSEKKKKSKKDKKKKKKKDK